jgi:hypothetical protein
MINFNEKLRKKDNFFIDFFHINMGKAIEI